MVWSKGVQVRSEEVSRRPDVHAMEVRSRSGQGRLKNENAQEGDKVMEGMN